MVITVLQAIGKAAQLYYRNALKVLGWPKACQLQILHNPHQQYILLDHAPNLAL